MTQHRMRLPALALAGILAASFPANAQDFDAGTYILDLEATVLDLMPTVQDLAAETPEISAGMQATLDRCGQIGVRQSGENLILSVASDVLFDFDSDRLSAQAQRSLTDVAAVIAQGSADRVLVLGHTDAKGTEDYNRALSLRRAQSVASFLEDAGIAPDRLAIEGRGETEPVAENEIDGRDNPAGRAQNRRVEFVLPKAALQN